ncbi:MAG TPA: acetyl-CoA carboxylase biotin carboxylase subunit [Kiloniellales bacterium]
MFDKILIANRGEIACRVMRTARRLGVQTVAVYSEADAGAMHVAIADEAYPIGPAPAAESYLRGEAIIAAAKRAGARAIHPGYGFLSENADFAQACGDAGLIFIGPPPSAIRTMGSKIAAKVLMASAGVPLVPGYHGEDQDPVVLARAAEATGYPVLIKASAGGGGKGMRVVRRGADFAAALDAAKREAKAAFADDRVLIETYLDRPRHIEVQVFADARGNTVHLFERDCSIQRRHQKVLEEAPAPGLTARQRSRMGAAGVAAARACGYVGAGTVEFICQGKNFYFMEMNTRLQVEHPVTEMITGQDLVEWQLRVALGEPLPLKQSQLAVSGHAIEVRLYAEDPAREFLPASGRLQHLHLPDELPQVRIDAGVRDGDSISVHYDPMIAKLIVWGTDRAGAVHRLRRALAATEVAGPANNVGFLVLLAAHPALAAGEVDTGFIERHRAELLPSRGPASDEVLALACLFVLLRRRQAAEERARRSSEPHCPWHDTRGWRLNVETQSRLDFHDGERLVAIVVHYRADGYALDLPGGQMPISGEITAPKALSATLGGRRVTAAIVPQAGELMVIVGGQSHPLRLADPLDSAIDAVVGDGRITAPMPGKVVKVHVAAGEAVTRGAPLIILEAMKMEHAIPAPSDGRIAAVHYAAGDAVEEGAELLTLETYPVLKA